LGARQTVVHGPELVCTAPSGKIAGVLTTPMSAQPHVHVEGQSESALHAVWAALHVFHVTERQVLPGLQITGICGPESPKSGGIGGSGTSAQGMVVDVA
jgi:hypothetical protein